MKKKLRIGGVPEHFNLPWRLAIDARAFAELGVEVELVEQPAGTGAMTAALRDNELDCALILTEGAVLDVLNGADNRLVSVFVDSPLIWGIHVAAQSTIRKVDDIEGKRYAISRYGSGSHLIAIVDAADRGFDARSMRFVVVDNIDGARAALADGTADVFLWEKHMTQPLVDSGEFRRIGHRVVPWPAFVVAARRDYLRKDSGQLRQVLDIVSAYAERLKNREDGAALISRTFGINLADSQAWLADVRWSTTHDCPQAALQRAITVLSAQGVIDAGEPRLDAIWQPLR